MSSMLASLVRRMRTVLVVALLARAATAPSAAGELTTIPAGAGTPAIPAYVARPASAAAAAPAVLVLHACDGYRTRYADIADDLARRGMVAVAIDTLAPRGVAKACQDPSGSRYEAAYARATLAWLRTQPGVDAGRLALLGYSMGAVAIMDIVDPRSSEAPPPGLVAAVAYYPACARRDAAHLAVPLAILDGDEDDWTPAPPCVALAAAAMAAGKTLAITTYPGATHAFDVDAKARTAYGHVLRYDATATADARTTMLAFFRRYLTAPTPSSARI